MIAVVVGDVNSDAAEVGVEVVAAAVVAAGVDVGEDVAVEVAAGEVGKVAEAFVAAAAVADLE